MNSPTIDTGFQFVCPGCGSRLERISSQDLFCPVDSLHFRLADGIWRFLLPQRAQALARFMQEYETVRAAEQRGSDDPEYYRALPFADLTNHFAADWAIRAASFQPLIGKVIEPMESGTPLALLDLGAGNGWLSYRLARLGHRVAAVDLQTNVRDGLGAQVHYDVPFTAVQAEFDCLPFAEGQFDAAIFNSSFHYSVHYESTLSSVLRMLKRSGVIVILDTPIYRDAASGAQMVAERQARFIKDYGFPSDALASENFLTYARLKELGRDLAIEWRLFRPGRGWRWRVRPWLARVRRHREPAEFLLIVGRTRSD